MNEEDKLRNALRDYYDTQPAPFDENEWERADAYLRAARNKRRLRYIAPALALLLSGLFVAYLNFPAPVSDNTQQISSSLSQNQGSTSMLQPEVIQKEKNISSTENKGPEQIGKTKTPAAKAPGVNSPVIPDKIVTASEIKVKKPSPGQTLTSNNSTPEEIKVSTTDVPNTSASAAHVAIVDIGRNGAAPEAPEPSAEKKDEVKSVSENSTNDQPAQTKELMTELLDTPVQSATTLASVEDKKEIRETDTTRVTLTQEEKPAVEVNTAALANTITIATQNDSLPGPAALQALAGEGIFYDAGAAWLYGWKGAGKRDARGFSPVAGINYMNQLSRRCAFSFGLSYLRVGGLSNSSKTSRVSTYTYGEQSKVTVITPTTVHYVVAPLRLHYYIDQRNILGAGVNLAYLLNIDATVTNYDERPGFEGNFSTVKQGGYTQGFSWFDSQLAVFYRRNITHSLAVQAEVFLGLTDVKQNEFFRLNATERNSGAKLSLVYYAFRKNNKR